MSYTARDHAFIYGVIAQELLSAYPNALATLEKSICVYGRQRGARMGQTADVFGDNRTMQSYLTYGEWSPAPGEMEVDIPQDSPSAVWHVEKCPWNDEWQAQDMMEVGKYYCDFVDTELVRGVQSRVGTGYGYNADPRRTRIASLSGRART